jgi:threonine/homoserine/homoserine lactone efflux protein
MSFDLLIALVAFAFVTSVTPGPNNIMLMTSGANFGFRRTLAHLAGVSLGFVILAVAVGLGLHRVFEVWPPARTLLKAVSLVYFLWLAWKFAQAAAPSAGSGGGRPMTFVQAAAFQWANPKVWAMALTAVTAYAPSQSAQAVVLVAVVFGAVNLPSVAVWALAGQGLGRFLADPSRLRAFNWTMAALLLLSAWPVLAAL